MTEENSEYFSKEGLIKLKEGLSNLKTKKRKEIADRLEYAKSLGDLSENSEYQEAKESQMLNESKIAELEDLVRRAVVVVRDISSGKVDIGSEVIIQDKDGKEMNFIIVGSQEASPGESKISGESPLGEALLKHMKNDVVKVFTPKGEKEYKIIEVK